MLVFQVGFEIMLYLYTCTIWLVRTRVPMVPWYGNTRVPCHTVGPYQWYPPLIGTKWYGSRASQASKCPASHEQPARTTTRGTGTRRRRRPLRPSLGRRCCACRPTCLPRGACEDCGGDPRPGIHPRCRHRCRVGTVVYRDVFYLC